MRANFKKIASFVLTILVLLSSTSFVVKKHDCPKIAQHETVNQKKSCCTSTTDEAKCCTTIIIEKDASSVDFITSDISFDFNQKWFVQNQPVFNSFGLISDELSNQKKITSIHFSPPDFHQKIYLLYETFLI
ncbi:MAG: HYC_CC_PP family protein [Flavobacteriales bacterium]